MVKSVVNEEYVRQANELYAKAGFVRRRKGQRHMPSLLPFPYYPEGDHVELLGTSPGYGSYGEEILYDHLVVTLDSGQRIPCYRRHDPIRDFVICQEFNYVPG